MIPTIAPINNGFSLRYPKKFVVGFGVCVVSVGVGDEVIVVVGSGVEVAVGFEVGFDVGLVVGFEVGFDVGV